MIFSHVIYWRVHFNVYNQYYTAMCTRQLPDKQPVAGLSWRFKPCYLFYFRSDQTHGILWVWTICYRSKYSGKTLHRQLPERGSGFYHEYLFLCKEIKPCDKHTAPLAGHQNLYRRLPIIASDTSAASLPIDKTTRSPTSRALLTDNSEANLKQYGLQHLAAFFTPYPWANTNYSLAISTPQM